MTYDAVNNRKFDIERYMQEKGYAKVNRETAITKIVQ